MIILAHRAQDKAVPDRFGVEIDVRDYGSWHGYPRIVVSHDPPAVPEHWDPTDIDAPGLGEWLRYNNNHPLYAVNVKADGLIAAIGEACEATVPGRYFLFDMSFPQQVDCERHGVPFAERVSERERYAGGGTVWLDRWNWTNAVQYSHAFAGAGDYIWYPSSADAYAVSPECHKPDVQPAWRKWWWREMKELGVAGICTDYWEDCERVVE